MIISVGSRRSNLARAQVQEISEELKAHHTEAQFDVTWRATKGDRDQKTSLRGLDKTDFFTHELDTLLLSGEIRVAIHSAKDLPSPLPEGLKIAALTYGVDSSDSLVLKRGATLGTLPLGAKIATSSERREESVKLLRRGLEFCDIRGSIEQRLSEIDKGEVEGVVVAEAALIRLNLTHLNRIPLPGPTAHLQGQLAVVIRKEDQEMEQLFSCLDSRQVSKHALYLGLDPQNYNFKGKLTHYPVIKIKPFPFEKPEIESAFKALPLYTHLLFTSKTSVTIFFEFLEKSSLSLSALKDIHVIAVGERTRELIEKKGVKVVSTPAVETSEGIVELLKELDLSQAHLFYPHSTQARPVLLNYFESHQITVKSCPLYEPCLQSPAPVPDLSLFDTLVFTSPSTVNGFLEIYDRVPEDKKIHSIGPITSDYLKSKKMAPSNALELLSKTEKLLNEKSTLSSSV